MPRPSSPLKRIISLHAEGICEYRRKELLGLHMLASHSRKENAGSDSRATFGYSQSQACLACMMGSRIRRPSARSDPVGKPFVSSEVY